MTYAEMLDAIIEESELSLRQISKLCTQFDISITPSYISQLKNGKLPPPSPEVSPCAGQGVQQQEPIPARFPRLYGKGPRSDQGNTCSLLLS